MFKNVPVTSTRTYHWDYRAVRHSLLPLYTLANTNTNTNVHVHMYTCTEVMCPECPLRTARVAEVCPHQTLTSLSRLPVTIMVLSQLIDRSVISA